MAQQPAASKTPAAMPSAEDIRTHVRDLVAEITERDSSEVSDTALFIEDLGIDSLMAIEMLVAMDKKYKVQIPEEEFKNIKCVNDAVAMVQKHLAAAAKSK
jgi:acyl carrier protein